ncbi:MAG: SRPBCC domain-containing protein [Hyphomicrobiales bacterium]|nr:SRPBCC domain-containing protein [Hyphomicrobiales bacterium]
MTKAALLITAMLLGTAAAQAETTTSLTRVEIDTHIDIPAPASDVWAALVDIAAYPTWNPYHVRVEGALEIGERLNIRVHKPNGNQVDVPPYVLSIEPEQSLVWGGGVRGIFHGVHRFDLESISETCTRLYQTEVFSGLFISLAELGSIEEGYVGMNAALAAHLATNADATRGRC